MFIPVKLCLNPFIVYVTDIITLNVSIKNVIAENIIT